MQQGLQKYTGDTHATALLHTDISLPVSSLLIHQQLAYKGTSGALNVTLRKGSEGLR
jgi:hypothetical protein